MFLVLLRFLKNKPSAPQLMAGHKAWIGQGIDDGVFQVVGSLGSGAGGAILAHGIALEDLEVRVSEDPFVAEDVVAAEILEITPSHTDPRLDFLMSDAAAAGA